MFIVFDVIFTFCFILYLPFLLLRGKGHTGFSERFGFFKPSMARFLAEGENLWLHAVSVGEVAAVDGIISGLRARFPARRIVLTVTTKTGHAFALRKYAGVATVLWSPLDLSLTVDTFVRVIRPLVYVAAETELWPNLFARLSSGGVPIIVLNGRISDQAYPRYRWGKALLKKTFQRVDVFAVQSELDAERVLELGAQRPSVHIMGNVKFDNLPGSLAADPREVGLMPGQLVLLGGSTHPGEESVLIGAYKKERMSLSELRLVLAPRHPQRAIAVAEDIRQSGLNPVLFSRRNAPLGPDDVLVVDTIGHLMRFYALASVVFVGKSLTARGGHNIIEPAVFAKPVIIGPHMQNFRDITKAFLAANALIQVEDAHGLEEAVHRFLADATLRAEYGARAKAVIAIHRGATQRGVDLVAERVRDR